MEEANRSAPVSTHGNYASVNGLEIYYEIHGTGEPLILLHGGFGSAEMFDGVVDLLAKDRHVIAVDLQAHGRTADIERPLRYESMADDVAALIKDLGLKHSDIMGYSLGGHVALRTAVQQPDVVNRLVVVSIPFRRTGMYEEVLAEMDEHDMDAEAMKNSPMYEVYARIAPRPQDWPVLVSKMSNLLRRDFDWSNDVAKLKKPVMIVVGDADSVKTAHAVEFFELLGGGKQDAGWDGSRMSNARLCILPGATHYDIFSSPALASAVIGFLNERKERHILQST